MYRSERETESGVRRERAEPRLGTELIVGEGGNSLPNRYSDRDTGNRVLQRHQQGTDRGTDIRDRDTEASYRDKQPDNSQRDTYRGRQTGKIRRREKRWTWDTKRRQRREERKTRRSPNVSDTKSDFPSDWLCYCSGLLC